MVKKVLEPSTNTHVMEASSIETKEFDNGLMKVKTKGNGIVTHGEHGTIVTESEDVIKYVQQEYNPITKKMQNAYD